MPPPPALPGGARWWVGCSGGLDSTVLLHLCHGARLAGLAAIHVHHGLQPAADDWLKHVEQLCGRLAVLLTVERVRIDPDDPAGPEGAARAARRAAFARVMGPGDGLVLAHHLDDQAETVLLRALRGTGVEGLAAMQPLVPFGSGVLWRPLLATPRSVLRTYAAAAGLAFVEDPHNIDPRFARSRLRTQVWPAIEQGWPQAASSLARLALQAGEAAEVLREIGLSDIAALACSSASRPTDDLGRKADLRRTRAAALSVSGLLALSPPRRFNAVRAWLESLGLPPPYRDTLDRLEAEVLRARRDAAPRLAWPGGEFRRYRDALHAMPPLPAPPAPGLRLAWSTGRSLELPPGCGRLVSTGAPLPALEIRFGQPGATLKPACGGPTRRLRNLFQERGVPPWVRERLPLLYVGDRLRCAVDYWCDGPWAASGVSVRWETDLPGAGKKT